MIIQNIAFHGDAATRTTSTHKEPTVSNLRSTVAKNNVLIATLNALRGDMTKTLMRRSQLPIRINITIGTGTTECGLDHVQIQQRQTIKSSLPPPQYLHRLRSFTYRSRSLHVNLLRVDISIAAIYHTLPHR